MSNCATACCNTGEVWFVRLDMEVHSSVREHTRSEIHLVVLELSTCQQVKKNFN